MDRWIIAKPYLIRIIGEYSVSDFVGQLFRQHSNGELKPMDDFNGNLEISGQIWKRLWSRTESDYRGTYRAVAFRWVEP